MRATPLQIRPLAIGSIYGGEAIYQLPGEFVIEKAPGYNIHRIKQEKIDHRTYLEASLDDQYDLLKSIADNQRVDTANRELKLKLALAQASRSAGVAHVHDTPSKSKRLPKAAPSSVEQLGRSKTRTRDTPSPDPFGGVGTR